MLYSFGNYIAIAVALCLAYVYIQTKEGKGTNQKFFIDVLRKFSEYFIYQFAKFKSRKLSDIETLKIRVEYYLNNKDLASDTKGLFKSILTSINSLEDEIGCLEENAKSNMEQKCEVKHLGVFSSITALYGIFLLFIIGVEPTIDQASSPLSIGSFDLFVFMKYTNCFLLFMLLCCIISEYKNEKYYLNESDRTEFIKDKKFEEGKKWKASCVWFKYIFKHCPLKVLRFLFYPTLATVFVYLILYAVTILVLWWSDAQFVNGYLGSVEDGTGRVFVIHSTMVILISGFIGYFLFYAFYCISKFIGFVLDLSGKAPKSKARNFKELYENHSDEISRLEQQTINNPVYIENFNIGETTI